MGLQGRVPPSSFYHLQSVISHSWAGGPGPCSLNHCPYYPELSTTEILLLTGKQQRMGRPWSAPPLAMISFANVPLHIPLSSILSQNPVGVTAQADSSAWASRATLQHSFHFSCDHPPTTNSNQANWPWGLGKMPFQSHGVSVY